MLESILLQLPVELLQITIRTLRPSDASSLRLTCRMLNSCVSPLLFRSLRVEFLNLRHCRLLASASPNSFMAPFVRNLEFAYVGSSGESALFSNGEKANPEKLKPEDVIATYLVSFVRGLQNLHSVRWHCHSRYLKKLDMYAQQVISVLAEIPTLKVLDIGIYCDKDNLFLPDISCFKDLTSLNITTQIQSDIGAYLASSVMPALVASPVLKRFSLTNRGKVTMITNLNSLMHDFNTCFTNPTAKLLELRLCGIPVCLDPQFRRVFQNLKHLTLVHDRYEKYADRTTDYIAWQGIWDALYEAGCNEGLWLETLDTEGVQSPLGLSALFNYLQSHPGLKALTIRKPPADRALSRFYGPDSDRPTQSLEMRIEEAEVRAKNQENLERATIFWSKILPRFRHSLRELSVDALLESPWCYGPQASETIRKCRLLEKLKISVSRVDSEWAVRKAANLDMGTVRICDISAGGTGRGTYDTKAIRWGEMESSSVLLAADLGELPLLKEVRIHLADEEGHRQTGARYGTTTMKRIRRMKGQAREALKQFVPWAGYPHKLLGNNGIILL